MPRRPLVRAAVVAVVGALLWCDLSHGAPFDELLPYVPANANALVFINPAKVRSSKLAQTEFADKYGAEAQAVGSALMSPLVEHALMASQIDFSSYKPTWIVAVAQTSSTISPAQLRVRLGGTADSIGGLDACSLPNDALVVSLGPTLVGASVPNDRQFATRWVRSSSSGGNAAPSAYLQQAISYANDFGTELVVAFDLEGLVSPAMVAEKLPRSDAAKGRSLDIDQASQVLASLQGATLGVRFTDKANGKLRFDFREDPAAISKMAKPLAIEVLNNAGLLIDDFANWEIEVSGQSIFLGGELTPRGLRQVLSVIDAPLNLKDDPAEKEPPSKGAAIAYNTQSNYKTIQILLNDARHPDPNKTGTLTAGNYAAWLDRYAKKIDRLPILNVDEDLVNFSATSAQQLRSLAVSYRGIGIRGGALSANATVTYNFAVDPWYGTWWTFAEVGPAPQIQAKKDERATVSLGAVEMWALMDDALGQMRRLLTQRYQTEFK